MNQSRPLLRLLVAVLVVALLTNGLPGPLGKANIVAADDTGIIVEDAASVETLDLLPDQDLLDAASTVDLRFVVEYARSLRHHNLVTPPSGLAAGLSLVSPRMLIEYANSVRHQDLISPPPGFGDGARQVGPRIVVEYAHSVLYYGVERPEEVPEDVPPFSYPLYHPWTDTLGFGQSWGSYYGHLGQDYAAPAGTPVYAVASGEVVLRHNDPYPGEMKGWGNALIIRHDVSESQTAYSQYAHFQDMIVDEGDLVELGQQIGTIGQTGFATGPHLHLEIKDTATLGPGFAGYSFTGDSWTHGGVTYYRPSTFIERYRGFKAGDELAVTGTGGVGLRLRSSPAISSGNILTVMPEGSQVTVIGGPTIAHGYGWWQVQFGALQGWAAGRYLSSTEGQVAPDLPTGLAQYTVDDVPVPTGGELEDTRIILKGAVTSPAGGLFKLQVEVRREGQAFARHTHEGPLVASGQQASVTVGDLALGAYQWRARAVSAGGMTSDWVYFSPDQQADFVVLPVLAARFSFYPSHPVPGEQVEFDASASYPSWRIVSYQWNFDDGHTATGKVVHHQFSETRTYDVGLTVEFDDGRTASVTYEVNVVSKQLLDAVNSYIDDAIRDLDRIVDTAEELAAAADYFYPSDAEIGKLAVRLSMNCLILPVHVAKIPRWIKLTIPLVEEGVDIVSGRIIDSRHNQGQNYQSIVVDPFRGIVEPRKTELLQLRDEVLDEIASVPPEQVGALLFDLRERTKGNEYIEHYLQLSSRLPRDMKDIRQHNERDWGYQSKKRILSILVGVGTVAVGFAIPGGIIGAAIYGGVIGFVNIMGEQHEFAARLDQDGEMSVSAFGGLTSAIVQAEAIFENAKDGLENIRRTADGYLPATVPLGRMASIEHTKKHAVEKSFGFFDVNWWVREAYSEVTIRNWGSEEMDYWVYVAIDRRIPSDKWLYVIPAGHFDTKLVLEDVVHSLSGGSLSDPVRFIYLDRKEGGFIPKGTQGLFFVLMAKGTGNSVYLQQIRHSTFGTTLITSEGEIIAQEQLDGTQTYEYPVRSAAEPGASLGDYTLTIFVSNPAESPLMAQLTQPLPVQGEVAWTDGCIVDGDTIAWELHLEAGALEVLEVSFTGVRHSPFEMPAAQYEMYDIINDSWLTFASDPLIIEIPLTIITDELSDGEVGVAYETTLEAFGGTPPYNWDWTAEEEGQQLPPGLDLAAETGLISGIPTKDGTFNFTAEVTDAGDFTATGDLSITVAAIVIPGDANGDGVINVLDLAWTARIIAGLEANGDTYPGADANQDGVVNVLDLAKIARIIAGLD